MLSLDHKAMSKFKIKLIALLYKALGKLDLFLFIKALQHKC